VIAVIPDVDRIAPNFGVCLSETRHGADEKKQHADKACIHGAMNSATFSLNTTFTSLLAANLFSPPKKFQSLATAVKFFPFTTTTPSPAAKFDDGVMLAHPLSMVKMTSLFFPQRFISMFDMAMELFPKISPVNPVISQIFTPFVSKTGTYNPRAGAVGTISGSEWSKLDSKKLMSTNFEMRLKNDFMIISQNNTLHL
jgi:hypothetical protein